MKLTIPLIQFQLIWASGMALASNYIQYSYSPCVWDFHTISADVIKITSNIGGFMEAKVWMNFRQISTVLADGIFVKKKEFWDDFHNFLNIIFVLDCYEIWTPNHLVCKRIQMVKMVAFLFANLVRSALQSLKFKISRSFREVL